MAIAEDVADLVEQDRQQIYLTESFAAGLGTKSVVREQAGEFGIVARGRVSKPPVTHGGGVDDYLGAGRLAQGVIRQIADDRCYPTETLNKSNTVCRLAPEVKCFLQSCRELLVR